MKKELIVIALSSLLLSYGPKPKKETSLTQQYIKDYNEGVRAQKNKNYTEAIQYYQSALNQKPDFPDAWSNLAYSYRMMAKSYLEKSGSAYEKAIGYNPKHEQAIEYQGEYFVMTGQLKNGYSNYLKLKQMDSSEAGDLKEKLDEVLKQAQSVLKEYSP